MGSQLHSFTFLLALTLPLAAQDASEDPVGLPEGVTAEDWACVRAAHEAGQHAVETTETGFLSRNPGQALTASFDGRGTTVTPESGDWTWGLELTSWGFEGALRDAAQPTGIAAVGARITYRWDPMLSEWWVNDARGLEHGFTVHERPDALDVCADQPLQFALELRGDLHAEIGTERRSVSFVDDTGRARLQYAGLTVFDADGETLEAWIDATEESLHIFVCDAGARYPLTIDPVVQQEAYIKASNTDAGDWFSYSMALSGDTLVVGAPWEESNATGVNGNQADNSVDRAGAAYVFVRAGGTWTQEAYLKASNTDPMDFFGRSVAISGDTLVVGAYLEDSGATGVNGSQTGGGARLSGAAYVFIRSGATWTQQAYLKASNTDIGDFFGCSVAISGDTLVVGAFGESSDASGVNANQADDSATRAGAAYAFHRSGGAWTQEAYLKASNTDAGDYFGFQTAIADDTVVVGALYEQSNATGTNGNQADNSSLQAGAAYVFVRNGGAWAQEAYLKASNSDALDLFGMSVAISGETLIVSAPNESSIATGVNGNQADNSVDRAGAAYVFVRNGGAWAQEAYLKASNPDAFDLFGSSATISGNNVVVGAYNEDSSATGINGNQADNSAILSGAAYVFVRNGGAWAQEAYVKASNTDVRDYFGWSLAASGNTLVVGAMWEDSSATGVNGNQTLSAASNSGAAYVFDLDLLLGVNYCTPNINSTGFAGLISARGSDTAADNDVVLMASSLPAHSFGIFLTGRLQGFVTNPGGSAGNLCLNGNIGRYAGPGQVQSSGATGRLSFTLDLTMTPTSTGLVSIQAGETWNFQAWHRDVVGGVATSNFTGGLSVLFQ